MPSTNPNRTSTPPTPPPSKRAAPACAACKHQRRRCTDRCLLLPYFPAHRAKEFSNVHKLFGRSNLLRLLEKVPEEDREEAIKSMIYEANLREINPVGGCAAAICHLQNEINVRVNELNAVYRNLAILRAGKPLGITEDLGQNLGITGGLGQNLGKTLGITDQDLGQNLIRDEFVGNLSVDESNGSVIDDPDQQTKILEKQPDDCEKDSCS